MKQFLLALLFFALTCFCTPEIFAQSPGDLVITEFMANPDAVLDADGEYVELYNTTGSNIDINGFTLRDDDNDSHVINNGGPLIVPGLGFIVLGINADPGLNGGVAVDYEYFGIAIANSADEIVLDDPGGTTICRISYTNGDPFGAGVSAELSNITLQVNGVTQEGDYVAATNTLSGGDLGSPGAPGNTQGTGGGDPPPAISNIARDLLIPQPGTNLTVSADITDDSDVTLAELRWEINGGVTQSVVMSGPVGINYSGEITGSQFSNGDVVEYWIYAEDDAPQSIESARENVFAGDTPIGNLHVNDANGVPLYRNAFARINGVATVGGGTFSVVNLDVYLQDPTGGVNVFKFGGDTLVTIVLGNDYSVTGKLDHFNGKTEIIPNDVLTDIIDNGPGTLPPAQYKTIAQLLANPESFEGELIAIASVSNTSGGDPWPSQGSNANIETTDDGGASLLTMRIDSDTNIDGTPEPNWPVNVQGIFGQFDTSSPYTEGYQLLPRSTDDIDIVLGVEPVAGGQLISSFRLHQNYPNPFNPTTTIRFDLPLKADDIQLILYNSLGQRIRTLVSESLAAGNYKVEWNGKLKNGMAAPGGVYFAVLKTNGFRQQSMKLVLMK